MGFFQEGFLGFAVALLALVLLSWFLKEAKVGLNGEDKPATVGFVVTVEDKPVPELYLLIEDGGSKEPPGFSLICLFSHVIMCALLSKFLLSFFELLFKSIK